MLNKKIVSMITGGLISFSVGAGTYGITSHNIKKEPPKAEAKQEQRVQTASATNSTSTNEIRTIMDLDKKNISNQEFYTDSKKAYDFYTEIMKGKYAFSQEQYDSIDKIKAKYSNLEEINETEKLIYNDLIKFNSDFMCYRELLFIKSTGKMSDSMCKDMENYKKRCETKYNKYANLYK